MTASRVWYESMLIARIPYLRVLGTSPYVTNGANSVFSLAILDPLSFIPSFLSLVLQLITKRFKLRKKNSIRKSEAVTTASITLTATGKNENTDNRNRARN